MRFIFNNIKSQTSFTQLPNDASIESLQERRMSARFSLFARCLAENIQPSFEYDLEKQHNTRQNANTYTPYIRTNAHYNSFWPRTIRELRQWFLSLFYSFYFNLFRNIIHPLRTNLSSYGFGHLCHLSRKIYIYILSSTIFSSSSWLSFNHIWRNLKPNQ